MQRFFVTSPLGIDVILTDRDIYHQLTRVLRIQLGEQVTLFDGDGSETIYEVTAIDKKSVSLRGQDRVFPHTEPNRTISLYQAIPNKYEKIEYIIQKWVEVGISKFIFFRSDRSQKLLLSPAKIERFAAIAREAVEQCGWVKVPEITYIEKGILSKNSLGALDCLMGSQWQVQMVLDITGLTRKTREYDTIGDIALWVGPEGGWSDDERTIMSDYGFIFARFGERVFRTETAGVVTTFALLHA
jgi:16S rRNA (uracil1498-N3)-methyltransferase